MIIFSVDESGKSVVKLKGKSEKIISVRCCFPPKFANSRTLVPEASVVMAQCPITVSLEYTVSYSS